MPEQNIRVGLIGGGYWGRNLARNFHALGALQAFCDAESAQVQMIQEAYPGVACHTDWQALITSASVDAVAIATPPDTHFAIAQAALQAGLDVFVEKPICHSLAEAKALNALADDGKRVVMAGHLLQYHAVLAAMRSRVLEGGVGTVLHVEARRLNIGKIYTERNVMWNFAPHDCSLVLAMFGDRLPAAVSAQGHCLLADDVCDMATMTLRYADGATAQIQVSWISPVKEARLLVYGSTGSAIFDDVKPWEEKLQWFDDYTGIIDGRQTRGRLAEPRCIPVDQGEPLRDECQHFLTCCQDRSQPLTSGHEAARVIAVLEAAQRSMDAGGSEQRIEGF